jgi:hypothetical protein
MIAADKRYLFVTTDDRAFTGLVVNVNETSISYKHKADDTYQNVAGLYGDGVYHMPRGFVKRAFALDELVAGKRYTFHTCSESFHCTFKSISGKYETVHCINDKNENNAFPLYWIKDITPI